MKRKAKNNRPHAVQVTGEDEARLVYGKGRNSVSQKVFGVRAFQAIKLGLAQYIEPINRVIP